MTDHDEEKIEFLGRSLNSFEVGGECQATNAISVEERYT